MAEKRDPETRPVEQGEAEERSTLQLVRAITDDAKTLVQKQVELGKHEVVETLVARAKAAGGLGVAAVTGLLGAVFLGLGAAAALALVLPAWASALIVAGAFFLVTGVAAAFGIRRMRRPPTAPEETIRTAKEDVEWAKAQLRQ